MNKYIIKNCPAHDPSIVEWNCLGSDACECKDGHCVLKMIVDKCKDVSGYSDFAFGQRDKADEILSMLEIEECGE